MLHQLQWDNLEARRNSLTSVPVILLYNKLVDIFSEERLLLTNMQCYKRPPPIRYLQPQQRLMLINTPSFPCSAIRIWNSLPSDIVKAETLDLIARGPSQVNLAYVI